MASTPQICFLHNEYALSYKVASHKQSGAEYTTVKAVTPTPGLRSNYCRNI